MRYLQNPDIVVREEPGEVWLCNPTRVRPATDHREGRLMCLGPSSGRFAALEHMACVQFT